MSADDMVAALRFLIPGDPTIAFANREFCCRSRERWVALASFTVLLLARIPRLFLGQTAGVSVFGDKWRTGFCRFELIRPPLLLVRLWQSARLFRELASVRPLASSRVYRSTLVRSLNPLNVGVQ